MKKIWKNISFLLALTLGCSMVLTACKDEDASSSSGTKLENENNEWVDGTHGGEEKETGDYIVKDGKTDYKIVLSQSPLAMESYAANELQTIFLEATGIKLPIVSEQTVTASDKFFSVGRTSLFKATGEIVDKYELRADGFKLFTKGDDIYLCGGEDTGTLYATYEYLYRALNFEQFYADCYTLDTEVRELKLSEYAVAERPDIGYRASSYGFLDADTNTRYRMRVSGKKFDYFTAVNGQACHNSFNWVSPDKYYDAHSDWFSADKTQLCYTARGNEESQNAMVDAALEKFKEIYANTPHMKAISLSMQDYQTWCACETCSNASKKYGTDAAVVIQFLNKLSRKMEAYVTELHKNEPNFVYDIDLVFFAYNSTTPAPVNYDEETDTYTPIDESVICDPHVAPWYAPIFMDYTHSILDSANISYYRNMYGWDELSETMYLWTYETNFSSYMSPYDTFNGMQDLFQLMAEVNTAFLFNQSQWNNQKGSTAWHDLKAYLTAKLSWNSLENVNELIARYFSAMYGPAEKTMKAWFDSTRLYFEKLHAQEKYQGAFSVYTSSVTTDYWSYPILRTWLDFSEQALQEIEKFKTADPELYANYYERIVAERVSPSFLMLELYEARLSRTEAREILDNIVADADLCGITRIREGGALSTWASSKVLMD